MSRVTPFLLPVHLPTLSTCVQVGALYVLSAIELFVLCSRIDVLASRAAADERNGDRVQKRPVRARKLLFPAAPLVLYDTAYFSRNKGEGALMTDSHSTWCERASFVVCRAYSQEHAGDVLGDLPPKFLSRCVACVNSIENFEVSTNA